MLRGMTMQQLQRWRWFSELEPFGERRLDYRFASIVQALSNIHRDSKKRPSPFTLDECVVTFGDPEETQQPAPKRAPWQQMKALANVLVKAFNKPGKAA